MSDQQATPETLFIKRFPAKGESPKTEGLNATSRGELYYDEEDKCWSDDGYMVKDPDWFLEPISLSSLLPEIIKMPSEEEITDLIHEWANTPNSSEPYEAHELARKIIKSLKFHLFSGTNNTGE